MNDTRLEQKVYSLIENYLSTSTSPSELFQQLMREITLHLQSKDACTRRIGEIKEPGWYWVNTSSPRIVQFFLLHGKMRVYGDFDDNLFYGPIPEPVFDTGIDTTGATNSSVPF